MAAPHRLQCALAQCLAAPRTQAPLDQAPSQADRQLLRRLLNVALLGIGWAIAISGGRTLLHQARCCCQEALSRALGRAPAALRCIEPLR